MRRRINPRAAVRALSPSPAGVARLWLPSTPRARSLQARAALLLRLLGCPLVLLAACASAPSDKAIAGSEGDVIVQAAARLPGRSGPPRIDSVTPSCAPAGGGALLHIRGQRFVPGSETTLRIGSAGDLSARWVSENELVALAPPRHKAGATAVTLQSPDGQRAVSYDAFSYCAEKPDFQAARAVLTGHSFVIQPALADLDGDGALDMVTTGNDSISADGLIEVRLGKGDGRFSPGSSYPMPEIYKSMQSLAIADMDADGKLDLVVATVAQGVQLLAGRGDGTFLPARMITVASAQSLLSADYNQDGRQDLAIAQLDGGIYILRGKGGGMFAAGAVYSSPDGDINLISGDFDGDGSPDLALASNDPWRESGRGLRVLLNRGGGTFMQAWKDDRDGAHALACGDFNGDGKLDLVTAPYYWKFGNLYAGKGDGTFETPVLYAAFHGRSIAARDLNLDGKLDIVMAGLGAVTTVVGNGDGTFAPETLHTNLGLTGEIGPSTLGDVDGDGRLDVAVSPLPAPFSGSRVMLLHGLGDGTFVTPDWLPDNTLWHYAEFTGGTMVDVDGDGRLDLIRSAYEAQGGADWLRGSVGVLLNRGGLFADPVEYEVGRWPRSVVAADWSRDGRPDLASVNTQSNSVSLLLNQGGGRFAPARHYDVDREPSALAALDYDGDGSRDLAVASRTAKTVVLLRGLGDGTLAAGEDLKLGDEPRRILAQDFNRDGRDDLALAVGYDSLQIFLRTDRGFDRQVVDLGKNPYLQDLASVDLNRDGNPDLIVGTEGGMQVLLGQTDGRFLKGGLFASQGRPYGTWQLLVADFDGDGRHDVAASTSSFVELFLGQGDGRLLSHSAYGLGGPLIGAGDIDGDSRVDLSGVRWTARNRSHE